MKLDANRSQIVIEGDKGNRELPTKYFGVEIKPGYVVYAHIAKKAEGDDTVIGRFCSVDYDGHSLLLKLHEKEHDQLGPMGIVADTAELEESIGKVPKLLYKAALEMANDPAWEKYEVVDDTLENGGASVEELLEKPETPLDQEPTKKRQKDLFAEPNI